MKFSELLLPPLRYVGFIDYSGPLEPHNLGPHVHDHYQMFLVTEGEFSFILQDGERIDLSPWNVCIFKPGISHNWYVKENMTCKTFMIFHDPFSTERFGELGNIFTENPEGGNWTLKVDQEEVIPFINIIRKECGRHSSMGNTLVFGCVISVMTLLARNISREYKISTGTSYPVPLSLAIDHIEKNYSKNILLPKLAAKSGMSVSRLSEIFRIHLGMAPMKYLMNLRIRKAKVLLRYSNLSIGEVASRTGFNSLHYFSRTFSDIIGESPSVYRQKQIPGNFKISEQRD